VAAANSTRAPRYDLRPGSPDVASFPTALWLRSTRRALNRAPASAYDYGRPQGDSSLRTALAEYLGRARGVLATPDQIVITSGFVQALALLTRALAEPATPDATLPRVRLAMEDPGLGFHRDVARRAGADVVALPMDGDGARTDLLPTPDYTAVRAAVLTPAHQYPVGVTLHPRRRHAATAWARATGGLVIEDDYDGEFRYDRQPVGALQGMAPDHVAYIGTAAKTLGPALRLAWVVLPDRLLGPVTELKRHLDVHSEVIGQLTLADLITSHAYDRHVRASRARYRRRRDLLVDRLTRLARSRGFTVRGIAAGLHVLIDLPPNGPDEATMLARAAAHGLGLGSLGPHWHEPAEDHPNGLVVGFGTPPDGTYPAALDTLARVLRGPHSP
jgi:GntR family transcriptional regulator/MocR family aminotransferase